MNQFDSDFEKSNTTFYHVPENHDDFNEVARIANGFEAEPGNLIYRFHIPGSLKELLSTPLNLCVNVKYIDRSISIHGSIDGEG